MRLKPKKYLDSYFSVFRAWIYYWRGFCFALWEMENRVELKEWDPFNFSVASLAPTQNFTRIGKHFLSEFPSPRPSRYTNFDNKFYQIKISSPFFISSLISLKYETSNSVEFSHRGNPIENNSKHEILQFLWWKLRKWNFLEIFYVARIR